ncbi:MAG: sulfatase [bacterium]|nr:sulfatase [bacterium]
MPCAIRSPTFALLLGLAVCTLATPGCRDVPAAPPALLEDVPFELATGRGEIERTPVNLGPETRPAIVLTQTAQTQIVAFESDPIATSGALHIEGAIAMQARDLRIHVQDRPIFRIRAVGTEDSRTLLERTGQVDLQPGQWNEYRIPIPTDLGPSLTIRFEISRPDLGRHESVRSRSLWSTPRIARAAQHRAPNVLLVVFDTLRADHTQPYGYARDTTPFLAQLAARGAVVRDFVATYPTTLTSHWSMFTGLFPTRHGVYPGEGIKQPAGTPLAHLFAVAGYATAAFTEGGYVHSLFGFDRGFDRYHNGPATTLVDHSGNAPATFELARQWLQERRGEPWFVFLHTYQVHGPYAPPPEYHALFSDDYSGRWQDAYPVLDTFNVNNGKTQVSKAELANITDLYDAEIRQLDTLFGAFWQALEAEGRLDETIVIITSDHGEDLMEHGWLQHGTTLYDPALRVPFVVVADGRVSQGAVLDCQRSQTDLMPTVLELAGLPIPEGLDGKSLANALARGRCDEDRPAFSELLEPTYERHADLPLVSLRHRGWKLIRHLKSDRLERYRIDRDPQEARNVKDEALTDSLEEQLDAYIEARPQGVDDIVEEISPEVRAHLEALGYLP